LKEFVGFLPISSKGRSINAASSKLLGLIDQVYPDALII